MLWHCGDDMTYVTIQMFFDFEFIELEWHLIWTHHFRTSESQSFCSANVVKLSSTYSGQLFPGGVPKRAVYIPPVKCGRGTGINSRNSRNSRNRRGLLPLLRQRHAWRRS